MRTIIEIDLIAKRANERITKEFERLGFSNPPVVTHGVVRAVLEAAEQSFAPDVCHKSPSKTHSWYGSSQGYVCEHCGTRR